MALRKIAEGNGFVVYKGRIEDQTDANAVRLSAHLTPEQRMDCVAQMSLWYCAMKGIDSDALRLDRSLRYFRRK